MRNYRANAGFYAIIVVGIFLLFLSLTAQYAFANDDDNARKFYHPMLDHGQPKKIFVFFDGTANSEMTDTNVYRLFNLVRLSNDHQTIAFYRRGVGVGFNVFGMAFGLGMQERLLSGYRFIADNYSPGDQVFIFGFSRGALQARALAGFLAYAGVPAKGALKGREDLPGSILDIVKSVEDRDYIARWEKWKSGDAPFLADNIANRLKVTVLPVEVAFLGVWDTVPGSSFKDYDQCKEKPDAKEGERYKTDSYPSIHLISHAVSMDEKRSKFRPLLICKAISDEHTIVHESWFPGAHSDIGGGYRDSSMFVGDLANISFIWMIRNLSSTYMIETDINDDEEVEGAVGLAHWSIEDFGGNAGSVCEDREIPNGAAIHPSYAARRELPVAPVRIKTDIVLRKYPFNCSNGTNATVKH